MLPLAQGLPLVTPCPVRSGATLSGCAISPRSLAASPKTSVPPACRSAHLFRWLFESKRFYPAKMFAFKSLSAPSKRPPWLLGVRHTRVNQRGLFLSTHPGKLRDAHDQSAALLWQRFPTAKLTNDERGKEYPSGRSHLHHHAREPVRSLILALTSTTS